MQLLYVHVHVHTVSLTCKFTPMHVLPASEMRVLVVTRSDIHVHVHVSQETTWDAHRMPMWNDCAPCVCMLPRLRLTFDHCFVSLSFLPVTNFGSLSPVLYLETFHQSTLDRRSPVHLESLSPVVYMYMYMYTFCSCQSPVWCLRHVRG